MNSLLHVTYRARGHVSTRISRSIARKRHVVQHRSLTTESSNGAPSRDQDPHEHEELGATPPFVDKLRSLRGKSVSRNVLATLKKSIEENETNRDNVLQTLHDSIIADASARTQGKKAKKKRQKQTKKLLKPLESKGAKQGQPKEETLEAEPTLRHILAVHLKGEKWRSDWGEDLLKPPDTPEAGQPPAEEVRSPPPHLRHPLPYTRRVEGILEHSEGRPLQDLPPPSEQKPVAKLAHGLDRVLFNPGVHWLQDPRSKVYNFTPWLESIPSVKNYAFERVTGFIKSSRDEDLWALAKQENRKFGGSTSSMTGMLCQVYFLLSGDRDVDTGSLSKHFQREPTNFTPGQRMPSSVILNYKDGVYTIDSDSSDISEKNILTWMGTMLEKFLTVPPEEFVRYLRSSPEPSVEDQDTRREAYRYSKSNSFVLRSQLDCVDSRLPGTGVFDIKTRAALPLRLDMMNYEENSGYLIRTPQGSMESFEKEYYDLIRSAFLKYSFQARIGNMDGVLVAYHNTARLFGFQYVPVEEMDARLFGGGGRGDRVFEKCIHLLEQVAEEVILTFPEQSLNCTFETRENSQEMNVWVEPAEWDSTEHRPIMQLDITSSSYLGDQAVRGPRAVAGIESPWLIHYTISRSSLSDKEIRLNLAAAEERKFRAWSLPAGVSLEKMEAVWENMVFGGQKNNADPVNADEPNSTFSPDFFREPSVNIEYLRSLARAGREDTVRAQSDDEGKPKVVWLPDLDSDSFKYGVENPCGPFDDVTNSIQDGPILPLVASGSSEMQPEVESESVSSSSQDQTCSAGQPPSNDGVQCEERSHVQVEPIESGTFMYGNVANDDPSQNGADSVAAPSEKQSSSVRND